MKKILSFLLVIIGLLGYSQDEYYRKVDWKFYPENVIQLTDSTYLTDAYPFDYNDVGAIQRVVGNYVVDFVGHRYSVIDSTATTITVLDIYHTGQALQTGQIARCYRSVGDGEAEYIGSIDYSPLDESSRWKLNGSDNELLWRQTIGKAENGLYKDLRTAKLGGNLIEPTTIDQDNNSFKILNNRHGSVFSETGIAYTKIDTVDFTDSTLVTKMYVKSLIKEGTSHDSLTIAAGSTDYFDVNYPQIFSGQKLIDSLGVMNTNIAGKAPAFSGTANYIPKFGSSGTTLENSQLSHSPSGDYLILDNFYAGMLFKKSGANKFIFGDDQFLTATRPDAYGFYLYGDNVIDFWVNNTRIASFGQSSGIQFPSLAGSDTRLVASQSDGKLVNIANAPGYLYNDGTGAMSFTAFPAAVTSVSAGNGMNFTTITGTGSVVLGTPTTLTASTTNAVTTTSHTHQITGFLPLTGGTLTGAVTSNNSFTGTNFILSSDKRLKQGIRTLTNTDWVERIKFVRYEMKSNPEIERYGVIAQDVEEVNKYLVHTDEYGIKSVSYIDLLVAKIANLEKRISELENKKKRHEK